MPIVPTREFLINLIKNQIKGRQGLDYASSDGYIFQGNLTKVASAMADQLITDLKLPSQLPEGAQKALAAGVGAQDLSRLYRVSLDGSLSVRDDDESREVAAGIADNIAKAYRASRYNNVATGAEIVLRGLRDSGRPLGSAYEWQSTTNAALTSAISAVLSTAPEGQVGTVANSMASKLDAISRVRNARITPGLLQEGESALTYLDIDNNACAAMAVQALRNRGQVGLGGLLEESPETNERLFQAIFDIIPPFTEVRDTRALQAIATNIAQNIEAIAKMRGERVTPELLKEYKGDNLEQLKTDAVAARFVLGLRETGVSLGKATDYQSTTNAELFKAAKSMQKKFCPTGTENPDAVMQQAAKDLALVAKSRGISVTKELIGAFANHENGRAKLTHEANAVRMVAGLRADHKELVFGDRGIPATTTDRNLVPAIAGLLEKCGEYGQDGPKIIAGNIAQIAKQNGGRLTPAMIEKLTPADMQAMSIARAVADNFDGKYASSWFGKSAQGNKDQLIKHIYKQVRDGLDGMELTDAECKVLTGSLTASVSASAQDGKINADYVANTAGLADNVAAARKVSNALYDAHRPQYQAQVAYFVADYELHAARAEDRDAIARATAARDQANTDDVNAAREAQHQVNLMYGPNVLDAMGVYHQKGLRNVALAEARAVLEERAAAKAAAAEAGGVKRMTVEDFAALPDDQRVLYRHGDKNYHIGTSGTVSLIADEHGNAVAVGENIQFQGFFHQEGTTIRKWNNVDRTVETSEEEKAAFPVAIAKIDAAIGRDAARDAAMDAGRNAGRGGARPVSGASSESASVDGVTAHTGAAVAAVAAVPGGSVHGASGTAASLPAAAHVPMAASAAPAPMDASALPAGDGVVAFVAALGLDASHASHVIPAPAPAPLAVSAHAPADRPLPTFPEAVLVPLRGASAIGDVPPGGGVIAHTGAAVPSGSVLSATL